MSLARILAVAASVTAIGHGPCPAIPEGKAVDCLVDRHKPYSDADIETCKERGCCYYARENRCQALAGGQCPYHKNSGVNCHPEHGANKKTCEARGCCWDDTDPKAKIWCYPKGPSVRAAPIKLKEQADANAAPDEQEWGQGENKTDAIAMPTSAPQASDKTSAISYSRACMLVQLEPGAVQTVRAVPDDVWGVYTLQYQTLNQMPVYRQHTFLCDSDKYRKDLSNMDAPNDHDLSCTQAHFSAKRSPFWMYYDSQQVRWMVGKQPAAKDVHVLSAISYDAAPDLVHEGNWEMSHTSDDGELMVKREPSIKTTCMKNPHKTHGRSAALPPKTLHAREDSGCVGWRKTAGCDPDGPREAEQDRKCTDVVEAALSGYCECASGIKRKVACGHKPFTCAEECKITFPLVLAQSGERTWTNQYARNLVRPDGDWLTSQTQAQWVVFDLGEPTRVRAVRFTMWGSDANPKDVMVEASDKYTGPWSILKRVTLPNMVKEYMTHIEPTTRRYWRLYFKDNWGADWGLGLSHIEFVQHLQPPKQADPCATFKTRDACVYNSVTSSNMRIVGHGLECGWCAETKMCMKGSASNPTDIKCDGSWLWNSLSSTYTDSCLQFTNCDKCTEQLSCGWCKASNDCRSNYCKNWAGRSCGGYSQLVDEQKKEDAVLQTQYRIGSGLVVAGSMLLIPTAVLMKRRSDYWRMRRNMKDQDAQWDSEASNIVEIHSYQAEQEAGESSGLLGGGGVADVDEA